MTSPAAPSRFEPGTVIDGKFRIIRQLGAGGMGAVFEIEHEVTKHRRALKLLHAEQAGREAVVERFLREASAAGRIGNPHIVETHDAGRLSSGEAYLVMELLRGRSLADAIAAGGLSTGTVVEVVTQAARAVQAAHDAGIVHRDLKPDNLFVSDEGGGVFVTVLDFGISKFDATLTEGMSLTSDGALIGTPYYMSPEQVSGQAADGRTDVYALGVILYEALAGEKPFVADSLPHLAVQIHQGTPPPIESRRPDVPQALRSIVAKAMSRSRDARYGTPGELADALASFRAEAEKVALDRTALAPGGANVTSGASPSFAEARSTAGPLGGTEAPSSTTLAGAPARGASIPVWAVVLAAALAAGAFFGLRSAKDERAPAQPGPPTADASREPRKPADLRAPDPVVASASSTARPEAAPSASAAPPTSATPAAPPSARTAASKAPGAGTGLSRDNPYK